MEIFLMSQVNYEQMSDSDLNQYFLSHRIDREAVQAYLDRRSPRPRRVIASLSDPDFDEKVQAAIRQKLEQYSSISSGTAKLIDSQGSEGQ
jgi:hypothetical protein